MLFRLLHLITVRLFGWVGLLARGGAAKDGTQARVEDRIGCGKNTGLAHLPSRDYAINQA